MKVDGELVSFGSVVISKKLGLAYLHNAGTLEQYRRKGYSSAITKHLCNLALKNGAGEIYGLLDKVDNSYPMLKKLDFEIKENFHMFAEED
ncbi:GNAT family N-acetyltransferase [Patescibacteria group bacterium]